MRKKLTKARRKYRHRLYSVFDMARCYVYMTAYCKNNVKLSSPSSRDVGDSRGHKGSAKTTSSQSSSNVEYALHTRYSALCVLEIGNKYRAS
ncbi:hypothetical protein U1Q18_051249 [Sarracenia purpurea var. burkii]